MQRVKQKRPDDCPDLKCTRTVLWHFNSDWYRWSLKPQLELGEGPEFRKGLRSQRSGAKGGDQIVLIVFWQPSSLGFEKLPTRTYSAFWGKKKKTATQKFLWQKADQFKSQQILLIFFNLVLKLLSLWLLYDILDALLYYICIFLEHYYKRRLIKSKCIIWL